MPRRSSGRSAPRPSARPRSPPPRPTPVQHAPPPVPARSGGLGSTIAQGLAFGTASAVAHRAVDAMMGPRTIQHEAVVSEAAVASAAAASANSIADSDACSMHSKAFQDCINSSESEISKCQFYMDVLSECRRNSGSGLGA